MSFKSAEDQDFFRRFVSKPFSTGPYTPLLNGAEAAVRVFKATLFDLCAQLGSASELNQVTVTDLLRQTCAVRNSMVTFGGTKTCGTSVWKQSPRSGDY